MTKEVYDDFWFLNYPINEFGDDLLENKEDQITDKWIKERVNNTKNNTKNKTDKILPKK